MCVIVGVAIPFSPLADTLGFDALPLDFFAILGLMVLTYLGIVEFGKSRFFRPQPGVQPLARRKPPQERRVHRRAARWSSSVAANEAAGNRNRASSDRPR
jgi:Mg2+-importing ATPase